MLLLDFWRMLVVPIAGWLSGVTYYFEANLLLVIDNLMSFCLVEALFVVEGICLAEALAVIGGKSGGLFLQLLTFQRRVLDEACPSSDLVNAVKLVWFARVAVLMAHYSSF
ncbi:hypothetical protein H0E87_014509 [Populus deltoides]|uniref:Uncharacterized protein n=1 Tax=Populus deltoides TaxID=3696 RepID=A0A8T2YDU0_POPDE|nr:hypothetical protein H0E87_014509 [Populus deltoides]